MNDIQSDSKLLSVFPWSIIFKSEIIKQKMFMEYDSITQKFYYIIEFPPKIF
jgi:hypothetical protein